MDENYAEMIEVRSLYPSQIRDISPDVLGDDGRMRILPASYWANTTIEERALFGNRNGIYCFPTTELVEHLRWVIDGRSAIEIGAGNGVLAEALDIPATDSFQQEVPEYRAVYESLGQTIVPYGPNVIRMDANEALRKYRPKIVIGAWVTWKFSAKRAWAGGNEVGVNERAIVGKTEAYIAIGNERVHAPKPIWDMPHTIDYPDWLYSRATNGSREFIATWH